MASALAQAPFVDATFTGQSADNDSDLIVVRERYDPETRQQALYLRVFDGSPDFAITSGLVRVDGAEIEALITSEAELTATDARWGVANGPYAGPRRGLEGPDPHGHIPRPGVVEDAVRQVDPNTAWFWFAHASDVDDLRLLIRYPGEPGTVRFEVRLFFEERPHPEGWPLTTQGGIQVGSLVDAVPDDGDYSEVFEVRRVKLSLEDVDLDPSTLLIGRLDEPGGVAGPAELVVDNYAEGADVDQDNGFDQNGLISPIPVASSLDHLRWRLDDLVSGGGDVLPADLIEVRGAPDRLELGERATMNVTVEVPEDARPGRYVGRISVFEDNDGNDRLGAGEPSDRTSLVVEVGAPEAFPDARLPDAEPTDAGPADMEPDADLVDAGVSDAETPDPDASDVEGPPDATPPDERGASTVGGPDAEPAPGGPLPRRPGAAADERRGDPRGGALSCQQGVGSTGTLIWALVTLIGLRRRR